MFVATRRLGQSALSITKNASVLGAVSTRAYSRTAMDKAEVPYTERQAKMNRPVSPHVTIYAFPTVAISSIMNRVTGVGLSFGVGGIGCASLAGVDVANMAVTLGNTNIVGPLLKFGVAFPLVYHYMGGVRHIMWDKAPDSLTNEAVQQSSLILIGAASAVSLGITML